MTCTEQISMTGYLVRYVDLREPKPRAAHEEDAMTALGLMGLNVLDFITTVRNATSTATSSPEYTSPAKRYEKAARIRIPNCASVNF